MDGVFPTSNAALSVQSRSDQPVYRRRSPGTKTSHASTETDRGKGFSHIAIHTRTMVDVEIELEIGGFAIRY